MRVAPLCFFRRTDLAQDEISPALEALAETERAFAKAATVKGIRDAFLEFFADDAVALVPEPASWKARLRAGPSVPFSEHELLWEPRVGDVAASGELGWLTGPPPSRTRRRAGHRGTGTISPSGASRRTAPGKFSSISAPTRPSPSSLPRVQPLCVRAALCRKRGQSRGDCLAPRSRPRDERPAREGGSVRGLCRFLAGNRPTPPPGKPSAGRPGRRRGLAEVEYAFAGRVTGTGSLRLQAISATPTAPTRRNSRRGKAPTCGSGRARARGNG